MCGPPRKFVPQRGCQDCSGEPRKAASSHFLYELLILVGGYPWGLKHRLSTHHPFSLLDHNIEYLPYHSQLLLQLQIYFNISSRSRIPQSSLHTSQRSITRQGLPLLNTMAAIATRPLQTHRHHPYILPQSPSSTSSTSLKRQSAPAPSRYAKAFPGTLSPRPASPERGRSPLPNDHPSHASHSQNKSTPALTNGAIPPSPPRSRRDPSETPSIGTQSGLGVAFGGIGGGKWWDEEIVSWPAIAAPLASS